MMAGPYGGGTEAMPGADGALERRTTALEMERFVITEQLRQLGISVDSHGSALDGLVDALHELSARAFQHAHGTTEAMAAALAQRDAELGGESPQPAVSPVSQGAAGETGSSAPSTPDLDALHGWVETRIAPMVRKTTTTGEGGGIRWCRVWWLHVDAVERFTAIYLAFAQLSQEESPLWLSVFLRDHLDPHLAVLTSPQGPFHACTPHRHSAAIEPLGHAELAATSISGGTDGRTDGRTMDG